MERCGRLGCVGRSSRKEGIGWLEAEICSVKKDDGWRMMLAGQAGRKVMATEELLLFAS